MVFPIRLSGVGRESGESSVTEDSVGSSPFESLDEKDFKSPLELAFIEVRGGKSVVWR
jgi:hypothetical protein